MAPERPNNFLFSLFTKEQEELLKSSLVIIMVGLPGAGKTDMANAISSNLGGEVLDSDVVRKNMTKKEIEASDADYEFIKPRVYRTLRKTAIDNALNGKRTIVDATHLYEERDLFLRALGKTGLQEKSVMVLIETDDQVIDSREEEASVDRNDPNWLNLRRNIIHPYHRGNRDEKRIKFPQEDGEVSLIAINNSSNLKNILNSRL